MVATETSTPTAELRKLFFEAARTHASNVMSVSRGHGFDRHFFVLQQLIREDETVPAMFRDPAYGSKRKPRQVMTNGISAVTLESGGVFEHPDGLSVSFAANNEL